MAHVNPIFHLRGINHLALVAKDMAVTVDFYTQILGFPLTKTMETPDGGQHFFFDMGNGVDALAFFWWADAPSTPPVSRDRIATTAGAAVRPSVP
jgi:catechol 2,3-dioxygenase-like lactoylglutathione lyase family enzyme